MEQAERLDRASRSRRASGDHHRSALRRTTSVRAARSERPVEPRLADAWGRRIADTDPSRRNRDRTRLIETPRERAVDARTPCGGARAKARKQEERRARVPDSCADSCTRILALPGRLRSDRKD